MHQHPVPNQSKAKANEALASPVRLLAQQSAQEVLSASVNEDIPDSAGSRTRLGSQTVNTSVDCILAYIGSMSKRHKSS